MPFAVDCRRYDDYLSILWGGCDGSYMGRAMNSVLADTGCFDAVVTSAGRPGGYAKSEAAAEGAAEE